MDIHTLILFTATILPLICTPGPDMLFVASQAMSAGLEGGLRATAGICLGYVIHSMLVTFGIAALVAASPVLFEALRWAGIAYLIYLALRLISSAFKRNGNKLTPPSSSRQLKRGFLTALLNPKGMIIYIAILPQFMHTGSNATLQALILSVVFVFWCGAIYTILSIAIGKVGNRTGFTDRYRRTVEAGAGALLILAAGFMAAR